MGHKKAKAPLGLDGEELEGCWEWSYMARGEVAERLCGCGKDSRGTGQPKHVERRWLVHTLAAIQSSTTPGVS